MSSGVSAERAGFGHEAAIYDSDEEFLAMVMPFLRDGIGAGEPTLLGGNTRQEQLVRDTLGDTPGLMPLAEDGSLAFPFAALRRKHELLTRYAEAGAGQVRILAEVPHSGIGISWDGWIRCEAAINHFYAAFPVRVVCPYDARTTPAPVLAEIERTHGRLTTPGGAHRPSPRYTDPATFLAERARAAADPLERTTPGIVLADPSPADGRQAVTTLARGTELDLHSACNLVLAVSEVVSNAVIYGLPPVVLRGWAAADRVVVAVRDHGHGPVDPFVGFLPGRGYGGHDGLGLWITNQLCSRVGLWNEPEGFTVRLVAGAVFPA